VQHHHHHHIDLGTVLRGTVCALYSNLVTRPTGAAVRTEIERAIADASGPTVTVIDFSQVMLLDFSCADEIVAKLMLRYVRPAALVADAGAAAVAAGDGYFVFRGIGDHHLDAVEAVLERHGLAIVAVVDGELRLVGELGEPERQAWELLHAVAPADAARLAAAAGHDEATAAALLAALAERRLAMPAPAGGWLPVTLPPSAEAAAGQPAGAA
jgi:hypothetical protein